MPTATWTKLPDAKRERFIEAALDEFGAHPYDQASITRIVKTLGIAKGSVYQYFGDKFDLFAWLLEEAGRRKLAALGPLELVDGDLRGTLLTLYTSGLHFWRTAPRWARLGLRLQDPSAEPRVRALRDATRRQSHAFLQGLVAASPLRTGVDADLAAHLLHAALSDGLLAAMAAQTSTGTPLSLHELDDATLAHLTQQAVDTVLFGLLPPGVPHAIQAQAPPA